MRLGQVADFADIRNAPGGDNIGPKNIYGLMAQVIQEFRQIGDRAAPCEGNYRLAS